MKSLFAGRYLLLSTLAVFSVAAGRCEGQTRTTVQLPTFHRFGTTTTVLVPDQGSVYLGGVSRSRQGQNDFGIPLSRGLPGGGNRGLSHASSAGGLSVGVTIIDHQEIDRALLAEAARRRGESFDVLGRPISNPPEPHRFERAATHNRQHTTHHKATAETYLRRARQAEADGQPHHAKIFYQRVAKHGNPSLQQLAKTRLTHLEAIISPTQTTTP